MNYPYYQPYYPAQDQLSQLKQNQYQPQNASPIIWVQGEAAARAYMVAAGNSVLLMDSDESVFYLKSTDTSGMPQPMRIFDYTERTQPGTGKTAVVADDYVTREEFNNLLERFDAFVKETDDGKSDI